MTGTGVPHRQIARSLFGIKLDMFLRHTLTKISTEDRIFTPNKPWCCKGWKALPLFPHSRAFHFHCKITNKYETEYLRKFRMYMFSATLCWILSQNGDLISFGRRGVSNTYSQHILKCKNEELCTQITKDIDRQ